MSARGIRNFVIILSNTMIITFIITYTVVRISNRISNFAKNHLSFVAFIAAMKSHMQTISCKIILLKNCFIFDKFKAMQYMD